MVLLQTEYRVYVEHRYANQVSTATHLSILVLLSPHLIVPKPMVLLQTEYHVYAEHRFAHQVLDSTATHLSILVLLFHLAVPLMVRLQTAVLARAALKNAMPPTV